MVNQPTGGNRVAHLLVNVPPSGSIPVTIRFNVRRVEESADLEKAQANGPRPTGGAFAGYLGPDRLVPIDGQIKLVSAKVGEPDGSSYEQAKAIYDYVIANMTYDKSGQGWGRGDAIVCVQRQKRKLHRLPLAVHRDCSLSGHSGAFYDWLSARRAERGHNPRLSLLGGILYRRPVGSGGRIGSVEAS